MASHGLSRLTGRFSMAWMNGELVYQSHSAGIPLIGIQVYEAARRGKVDAKEQPA
jgi:hypothetical protein